MTQNKARRTNKIDFLQLPWAQEVRRSNLHAPTNPFNKLAAWRVSWHSPSRLTLPLRSEGNFLLADNSGTTPFKTDTSAFVGTNPMGELVTSGLPANRKAEI